MGDVLIPMSTPKPKSAPVQQNIAVEPEDEERQRRIASLERARRSRAATLKTSAKGLLVAAEATPPRKSLLGQ